MQIHFGTQAVLWRIHKHDVHKLGVNVVKVSAWAKRIVSYDACARAIESDTFRDYGVHAQHFDTCSNMSCAHMFGQMMKKNAMAKVSLLIGSLK